MVDGGSALVVVLSLSPLGASCSVSISPSALFRSSGGSVNGVEWAGDGDFDFDFDRADGSDINDVLPLRAFVGSSPSLALISSSGCRISVQEKTVESFHPVESMK